MKKLKVAFLSIMAICLTFGAACSLEVGTGLGSTSESSVSEMDEWANYETLTIAEALELCGEPGNITEERYYLRGIVKTVSNPEYGSMTIVDETGEISVYGTYSADGALKYNELEEVPYKGDEVLLHCILQNYNGTKEVKNARLIDFKSNQGNADESNYTEMTIAQARTAEEGALVKVDGVVARITYANGMKPSGVYLVDETQSIYVYDVDLAGRVEIGNKVTILGSKTWWILESEQTNAEKFGYKGCCQIDTVTLVSNDEGQNDFDKTWITESTVKDIVETSVTEDITTTIYKVNALVKEVPGKDFTNFYFFDLDGETGSYAYSQCSGSDFTWLREFDGKICTVYLSAINAKSTSTDCFFRLLPIAVSCDNYVFDTAKAPEFALEYYAVDQFAESYTADPALEVTTSVSSALLGIDNVTLTYSSSNESVVYFTTAVGKTVMHCGENGTATVTITATYGQLAKSETVTITKKDATTYAAITVAEAINAAVDSEVTVKGIVGPSVVNKDGFYLFGEDGSMIAVLLKGTGDFVGLEMGHEIILKGTRERYVTEDTATYAGQTCIVDGEILVNNYGEHEYSTAKFTEATAAEFYALDGTVDYSTSVFVVTAKVEYVETAFYTSLKLTSGDTTIGLYMSGAGQYAWLQAFTVQEVTMEIAACNWNDKTYWRGCVLAVRTADGKVYNTLNFDNN